MLRKTQWNKDSFHNKWWIYGLNNEEETSPASKVKTSLFQTTKWTQWKDKIWTMKAMKVNFQLSEIQIHVTVSNRWWNSTLYHWYLILNFASYFQSRFWSQWLTHLASITLEQISLFRSTSRFYQILCMVIPDFHPQLLNPNWQQTAQPEGPEAIPAAQQHWDPFSNLWVWSPAQDGALNTRSRPLGHGEMGSKWRWQALREVPWWVCMYRCQEGYFRVRDD